MTKDCFKGYQALEICHRKELQLEKAFKSAIIEIVEPPQFPLTIGKIQNELRLRTNIDLPKSILIKFLKHKLRYSLKKGSNLPKRILNIGHKLAWSYFSLQMLRFLLKEQHIVSWDESSFSRLTKRNYSWLPMKSRRSIINNEIINKWNLVLSIFSDGSWISMLKKGTVTSINFWIHLYILSHFFTKFNELKEAAFMSSARQLKISSFKIIKKVN